MTTLKKELGLLQGIALFTTTLLGTGVFMVPAVAATQAGEISLWSWIIMAVLVLPIAFTFAMLGRRYPNAGGAPHYIGLAFGPRWQRLGALLLLISIPVGLPAGLSIASGFWLPFTDHRLLIEVGTLLLILITSLRGSKGSANTQFIIALVIIGLIGTLLWQADLQPAELALPKLHTADLPLLSAALALIFWCFIGIEVFAHLSEEFRRPERDFPLALLLALLIACTIYWLMSSLVLKMGAYGEHQSYSLSYMIGQLFGTQAQLIAAIAGYLTCFAAINVYVNGFARLLWSMARQHAPTHPLAALSKAGVPTNALGVIVGLAGFSILLIYLGELPLATLILYNNGLFILIYLLAMLAAWQLLPTRARWLAGIACLLCGTLVLANAVQMSLALIVMLLYLLSEAWLSKRRTA